MKFTDGGSAALLAKGKAAFELMGSWEYSTQQDASPAFAKKDLGYSSFPTIAGGKGDPANLVGNTNNFYSVLKNTRYPDAVRDFLKIQYSDEFVKAQARRGQPAHDHQHREVPRRLGQPRVLEVPVRPGEGGPRVPGSWDQAYPPAAITPIHQAVQQFFNGGLDADGFVQAMQALPPAA
ncbi:hypothetical protein GCM10025868_22420 [Angustibacter aerolatus]|uniref:Uncharacterized protein n=1 Tax=Angustibacter aerolatus TaxID=1162965 RepID=A0ABQ6JGW3_9ACTN|nr:extracellular solute-binding protein [Angustibacter aerolatus]GMA86992.1 hypothetical protein GCM10025868_22420 [Angustibacter aerolatus]